MVSFQWPPEPEFHFFVKLPSEIRLMIWKMCLPRRVINIGRQMTDVERKHWKRWNEQMPTIARVCYESRNIVLQQGHYFNEGRAHLQTWGCNPWYQRHLDLVYLDWEPGAVHFDHTSGWYTYGEYNLPAGNAAPLTRFLTDLVGKEINESCIRLGTLFPFRLSRGGMNDFMTKALRQAVLRLLHLRKRRKYYVILQVVDIRVTKSVAKSHGLFSLLADEPVQLVDPNDKQVFRRFYDMLCEEKSRNFHQTRCLENDVAAAEHFVRRVVECGDSFRMEARQAQKRMIKLLIYLCALEKGLDVPSRNQLSVEPQPYDIWRLSKDHAQYGNGWFREEGEGGFGYVPRNYWWPEEIRGLEINEGSEWVRNKLKTLPEFQPRIMFRLVDSERKERPSLTLPRCTCLHA
ncbi:hypothetical protein V8F20_010910 [Naviculisporaceae sp. PSN 640]